MIALEKLLLLKSITFFRHTPDDLLIQLIETATTEQSIKAGQLIIEENDEGTDLYVIVHGRVKIHVNDIILAEIGEREIFGEYTALSLEKQVFSVSSITDCLLLRINNKELQMAMNYDKGLANGIILSLSQRVRYLSLQLQDLLYDSNHRKS